MRVRPLLAAAGASPNGCSAGAAALRRDMHLLLRQVSHDYDRLQYNTVVSGAMKMLNAIDDAQLVLDPLAAAAAADGAALREAMNLLLRTLYPTAPHITHALWRELGYEAAHGDIIDAPWPTVDEAALEQDEIELVLQVSGKLRGSIRVAADATHSVIEAAALASPEFQRFSAGKPARKVIVVPGRLVNVVV